MNEESRSHPRHPIELPVVLIGHSKTYNALNEVLTSEDGNGVTTTNTWDGDGNLTQTSTPLAKTCTNNGTWKQVTTGVTAGHSYTITLVSHDDNYAGDATYTYYDDVATSSVTSRPSRSSACFTPSRSPSPPSS